MATGINDLNFVANVTERDIDFLVLEELQVSHEFREWFSARVFESPVLKTHGKALHSVVDSKYGESDLIFIFDAEDGSTKAILIENKISARPQPDQAQRYIERGEKGKAEETWQEYRTCVIAPRNYLESPAHAELYQCEITYEEIMAFFSSRRTVDERSGYRAKMMLEAVTQHRRGYTQIVDQKMTTFAKEYWQYVQSHYPNLKMPVPKPRAAGNTWIYFFPSGLPKSVDVVHQLSAGYVKVFFKQQASDFEAIRARYQDMVGLIPGLEVELTGKSVAISVPVDSVKPLEIGFETAQASVAAALETTSKLVQELISRGLLS